MGVSKLKAGLLLILLLVVSPRLEGTAFQSERWTKLLGRCVGNCSYHELTEEISFALADVARSGRITIRLCSSERSEIAVAKASTNLTMMVETLKELHKVDVNDVLLLFSRSCGAAKPERKATEFWGIFGGASLPPHEKSIKISELSLGIVRQENGKAYMKTLLSGGEAPENAVTEPQAISKIDVGAQMLSRDPGSYGVVIGFYFKRPTAELKRQVRLAKQELEKDQALRGRFSTHLIPYGFRYSDSVEPTEPSLYIIRLSAD
jgi:hypothetical protein